MCLISLIMNRLKIGSTIAGIPEQPFEIRHTHNFIRSTMKTSSFFSLACLALVFSVQSMLHPRPTVAALPAVLTEQTLADKKVYYFIEAQCADCSPAEGRATGKYLIVTPGISTADYQLHPALLEKFRTTLALQFPNAPALRDGLVFSFHFTTEDAEDMRQAELEQKQADGYEIIELDVAQ